MLTEDPSPRLLSAPVAGDTIAGTPCRPNQEDEMIVMLSARRLKPGAWEEFRQAWEPGELMPPGFQRAYHARTIRDEDEVISFGLFDMSEDDSRRWREEPA